MAKLSAEQREQEILEKMNDLLSKVYDDGFMDGMNNVLEDSDEDRVVRRFHVTPTSLIAFLIIVLGSVFSLGMYIGGLNG